MKQCSKCLRVLDDRYFHIDNRKKDKLYPSCIECRRKLYGNRKMVFTSKYKICSYCGLKIKVRKQQIDKNMNGKYFCSTEHRDLYKVKKSNNRYYGYRKYILERDNYSCVICGSKKYLNIHHIITRGAGGSNEYINLVTLCGGIDGCHIIKAHGIKSIYYKKILINYTSNYERPEFWDKVMELSKYAEKKAKKHINIVARERYKKIKKTRQYIEYKKKQKLQRRKRNELYKKYRKYKYTTYIQRFKKTHNGLSPYQYKIFLYKKNSYI